MANTQKEFVTYESALALKELGFDEPCFGRYHYQEAYPMLRPGSGEMEPVFEFGRYMKQTYTTILAPLLSQAFRFFREEHNLVSWVYISNEEKYFFTIVKNGRFVVDHQVYAKYEEAELDCLKKLIEIVKDGK